MENEEDIDIVGDDGTKANTTTNTGSDGDSSRDLQLHVYGPPQFTEADVLACMKDEEENGSSLEEVRVKREATSPFSSDDPAEAAKENIKQNRSEDTDPDQAEEEEVKLETLKEKLKKLEDSSKCSKCLVSFITNIQNLFLSTLMLLCFIVENVKVSCSERWMLARTMREVLANFTGK